ncbi:class I SAM-dependent methyltransferase [uncultured Sphingomonas sp.]|uniref:class I SAM-dependent methyltransferase n=1 Tax=uncultured Sphingomonas sp. TaxID=158754 RepID=UPI0035CABAD4
MEVAPYYNPLFPKRDGYNIETLDVHDTDSLRKTAEGDPYIDDPGQIENVNHVGSAVDLVDVVDGPFDYIASSHNFEHLPNPIRFLQGVTSVLKPGGQLVMTLPDFPRTFDAFRSPTLISDWLEAFEQSRERPTDKQVFEFHSYACRPSRGNLARPLHAELMNDITEQWRNWHGTGYRDVHCSTFCPASFELLILEGQALGLINLTLETVTPANEIEFYVRLRNIPPQIGDVASRRQKSMHRVQQEVRQNWPIEDRIVDRLRQMKAGIKKRVA